MIAGEIERVGAATKLHIADELAAGLQDQRVRIGIAEIHGNAVGARDEAGVDDGRIVRNSSKTGDRNFRSEAAEIDARPDGADDGAAIGNRGLVGLLVNHEAAAAGNGARVVERASVEEDADRVVERGDVDGRDGAAVGDGHRIEVIDIGADIAAVDRAGIGEGGDRGGIKHVQRAERGVGRLWVEVEIAQEVGRYHDAGPADAGDHAVIGERLLGRRDDAQRLDVGFAEKGNAQQATGNRAALQIDELSHGAFRIDARILARDRARVGEGTNDAALRGKIDARPVIGSDRTGVHEAADILGAAEIGAIIVAADCSAGGVRERINAAVDIKTVFEQAACGATVGDRTGRVAVVALDFDRIIARQDIAGVDETGHRRGYAVAAADVNRVAPAADIEDQAGRAIGEIGDAAEELHTVIIYAPAPDLAVIGEIGDQRAKIDRFIAGGADVARGRVGE